MKDNFPSFVGEGCALDESSGVGVLRWAYAARFGYGAPPMLLLPHPAVGISAMTASMQQHAVDRLLLL